jgi:RNA polymerase sigma-70 factor, ECF subfamily
VTTTAVTTTVVYRIVDAASQRVDGGPQVPEKCRTRIREEDKLIVLLRWAHAEHDSYARIRVPGGGYVLNVGMSGGFDGSEVSDLHGHGGVRGSPSVSGAGDPGSPDRGPRVRDPEPGFRHDQHAAARSAGTPAQTAPQSHAGEDLPSSADDRLRTRGIGPGPPAGGVPAAVGDEVDHDADRWLVAKVRGGDVEAYEVLIRRHRDRIYRIALRMLGNRHDAEDVAQDVIIQLWTAVAGFTGAATFTTWLYRIVVNRCLNHQRRPHRIRPLTEADHPSAAGADDAVIARQRAQATLAAIGALPPELRVALVLCQLEGLSHREVATILKVSEPVVRGRLSRARRTLVTQLRDWT